MRHLNGNNKVAKTVSSGRMMVEMLAVFALIIGITPVLLKKSLERSVEIEDMTIASQMRTLKNSAYNILVDNYAKFSNTSGVDEPLTSNQNIPTLDSSGEDNIPIDLGDEELKKYLPDGFRNTSKFAGSYKIGVHRKMAAGNKVVLSAIVVGDRAFSAGDNIRGARIASMIGAEGGYMSTTPVGGQTAGGIYGGQGLWALDRDNFDSISISPGSVVAATTVVGAANASGGSDGGAFLYRKYDPTHPEYNTMSSNLFMGGYNIETAGVIRFGNSDSHSGESLRTNDHISDNVSAKAAGGNVYQSNVTSGSRAVYINNTDTYRLDLREKCTAGDIVAKTCDNLENGVSFFDDMLLAGLGGGASVAESLKFTTQRILDINAGNGQSVAAPVCPIGFAPVIYLVPRSGGDGVAVTNANAGVDTNGNNATTSWTVNIPTGGATVYTYCKFYE